MLIKDNHIRIAGGIAEAVRRVRERGTARRRSRSRRRVCSEVDAALAAGADIIMLDNLDDDEMREAVRALPGARAWRSPAA